MQSLTKIFMFILAILAISTPLLAQSEDEFLVNTTTDGTQMYSDVAMDGLGNFVITWYGGNILAQRFNNQGNRLGSEFQINIGGMYGGSEIAMD
ncbi:hypothetical protein KKB18_07625, partial [bacterium]|nr:hypothetical protein [bacterium]